MKLKSPVLWCFCALFVASVMQSKAQDTLRITLTEAENIFIEKNLTLLSENYNVDIAKAQLLQAKLYSNPNVAISASAYNTVEKKIIDISNRTGQYTFDIQKVIRVAGKRNKEIKLAETNITISENKFFDLLRTLRFTLRSNFFNALYLQYSIDAYHQPISSLEKLSIAYDDLKAKGVVTIKDAVRIKSLLYSLKAEQASIQNQLNDIQSELKVLLHGDHIYYIVVATTDSRFPGVNQLTMQSLLDTAYANRYDLGLSKSNILYSEQNLALQKAMAKPDITLGGQFDKRGSYVDNAAFITASMELPFFNRNQGNIKAAKITIEQNKVAASQQKLLVDAEVQNAYMKLLNTDKLLQNIDPNFKSEFEKLLQGVTDNFQKKNISLLEFTDFYESYKENVLQLNMLQNEWAQAAEALNYATGKTIIHY